MIDETNFFIKRIKKIMVLVKNLTLFILNPNQT